MAQVGFEATFLINGRFIGLVDMFDTGFIEPYGIYMELALPMNIAAEPLGFFHVG